MCQLLEIVIYVHLFMYGMAKWGTLRINLDKGDTMNKKLNNCHARTDPAGSPRFQILRSHARNRRQRSDVINAFV